MSFSRRTASSSLALLGTEGTAGPETPRQEPRYCRKGTGAEGEQGKRSPATSQGQAERNRDRENTSSLNLEAGQETESERAAQIPGQTDRTQLLLLNFSGTLENRRL